MPNLNSPSLLDEQPVEPISTVETPTDTVRDSAPQPRSRQQRRISWRDRAIFLATVIALSTLFCSVPDMLSCNSGFYHDILHSTCSIKLEYKNFQNLQEMGIYLGALALITPMYWTFNALISAIVGD
jgi:hypothetical protein